MRLDDDEAYIGKVCKGYDAIAGNNNLSMLIKSENLKGVKAQNLFKEILENNFIRGHDFEITSVQKGTSQCHAYIVASIYYNKQRRLSYLKFRYQTRNYSQGVLVKKIQQKTR